MRASVWVLIFLFSLCSLENASALPWDTDMNKQSSYKPNEMARAPVKGTVPLGKAIFSLSAEEAEKNLTNPVPIAFASAWRGRRIWSANCATCHGKNGSGNGPVGPLMQVPSLLADFYKSRSDGRIFYVIHNGGANMPRYGYKLSVNEHWDVVNYLRFLQGADIPNLPRPE